MDRTLLWEERVEPGASWSHVLKRGTALRLIDIEGGANASAMFYNADLPVERYNMPDTLKAQHIARLCKGFVLYSDMGRILCSVTADSLGWHDAIGGYSNAAQVRARYGEATYQDCRNDYHKNGRDSFLIELGKYGLDARDLTASLNLFSKVTVAETGALRFAEGHSTPGSSVELRAELNVLTVLNTCPHPLNPAPTYSPKPVHLQIYRVPPPAAEDECRMSRPENQRGFTLTERYWL